MKNATVPRSPTLNGFSHSQCSASSDPANRMALRRYRRRRREGGRPKKGSERMNGGRLAAGQHTRDERPSKVWMEDGMAA